MTKTDVIRQNIAYPDFNVEHKKKCMKCIYRTKLDGGFSQWAIACQYILIERKRRPCPASACTVFKEGRAKKSVEAEMYVKTV